MAFAKAKKELEKELLWMRGEVARVEAVLALMNNNRFRRTGVKKYKMSAATRRKISLGRKRQLAAKK